LAVASAMPEVAAVMTATFPVSFPMSVFPSNVVGWCWNPLPLRSRQRAEWSND
jgi:hypothetical protein